MFPADQIDAIAGLVEDSKSSHLGLDSRAPRIGPRTNTAATLKELVLGKQPLDLSKPAGEPKKVRGSPDQSFWLLLINEDGNATFAAVNASVLAPGGPA